MSPTIEELKKQDIIDQLTWDESLNANEIQVNVQNGTVQLKGTVPNFAAKIAAERDTMLVEGVTNIENYLRVEFPPRDTSPTDEETTSNVLNILKLDSRILSEDIKVDTVEGMVTLSGSVYSYWEKDTIQSIVGNINGVLDVNNKLDVNLSQVFVDLDIETDIKNAYKRNALIDENKIKVSVTNGIVRLTGSVSNYLIKNEAIEIAVYTKGIIDVIDEITIG